MNHSQRCLVGVTLLVTACTPTDTADNLPAHPGAPALRIVHSQAIPTLDPHFHETFIGDSVLGNVYEKLVVFDGSGQIVPQLAVSWEQADERTWRFSLRPNVKFHDGSELTAEGVVASFLRARDHEKSRQTNYLVTVEGVTALDDHTVEIVTSVPDPTLLNKLVEISIVAGSPVEEIEEPIGSGPYRFESQRANGSITVVAFGEYWGAKPDFDSVELLFEADDQERARMLLDGEVDLISRLPLEALEEVEERGDLWVESRVGSSVRFLMLNHAIAPLSDPRVREAIDLAVDRQALVVDVLKGHARPAGQLAGPDTAGYVISLGPRARDLDRAKRLISAASEDGRLELTLYHGDSAESVSAAVAAQLQEAGLLVTRQALPWPKFIELMKSGKASLGLLGWSHSTNDAGALYNAVIHTPDAASGFGGANFLQFSDPEIDSLIEASNGLMDVEARVETLREIAEMLAEARYLIPLLRPMDLYGLRRSLQFEPRQDGFVWVAEIVKGN